MSALIVDDVRVHLGLRAVLAGVSCELAAGEVLGVIGPNGAGKSTLLRVMAGLLHPAGGSVRLDGRELQAWPAVERGRRIGYLPQSAPLHWPLDVRTVVELGRLPWQHGWFSVDEAGPEAVATALLDAEVEDLQHRLVNELSGGERTRVMIARLLAAEPLILLADEPVAALDVYHQLHAMELLAERAVRGTAVAVVLHDLSLAARFCDRVLLLHHGAVIACGAAREVLQPAILEPVYGVRMRVIDEDGLAAIIPWQRG
ncbi:MAG: ABC transporter ATP-binding protein [Pseudomonadales bacterium]|nr:ABC transporter ATP-binding protein [Pseudomonadales bacterium]MCP5322348.1 ABC transporter ATP-binding protein [Pseudomonadales bacterium]